jgi:hypothetical protein
MGDAIELSDRQRERFEELKEECTEGGRLPKPSDSGMIDSLLDTWEAVDDGLYSEDWTLTDIAYLSRTKRGDSVEFEGHTGDMLGAETSGVYAVFRSGYKVLLVDNRDVDPQD